MVIRLFLIILTIFLGINIDSTNWEIRTGTCQETKPEDQPHPAHPRPNPLIFKDIHLEHAFDYMPGKEKKGTITYTINEPGLVSIRVKMAGTRELFLATIVNWEKREAGTHTETWDGRDYDGNVIDERKATIEVSGELLASLAPGTMPLEELSEEEVVHGHKWGHTHAKHHEYAEEVPILNIISVGKEKGTKGKIISIGGKVTIKAEVDKEKRGYGNKYGYGVRYYIDNILAHEEFYKPESNGVFSYELDTTAFEDGKHVLYLGMCDHYQHATSRGAEVIISNSLK